MQAASPQIHLVVGPVGAGKSTYAIGLCRQQHAVRLTLDDWMARLFAPDRPSTGVMPWYVERTQRCIEQIWALTQGLCAVGTHVVLEIGLLRRADREALYRRVDQERVAFAIHVLDAPRAVRRERVAQRNKERGPTFSMEVPAEIFELASDLWEAPGEEECRGRDVRWV